MEKEIFVSYSRHDSTIVDAIVHRLESKGFSVWEDRNGIESGEDFKRVIVRAIENCKVVLFFSSRHSNVSEWTAKEIGVAVYEEKHIIPILLDHSKYNPAVKFDLINLDFLDFTNLSLWDKMMVQLEKTLSIKCSHHTEAGSSSENQRKKDVGASAERPRIVEANDKTFVRRTDSEVRRRRASSSTRERSRIVRQNVWLSLTWKLFFVCAIISGLMVLYFLANLVGLFTYYAESFSKEWYHYNYIFDIIVGHSDFNWVLACSLLSFFVSAFIAYKVYRIS